MFTVTITKTTIEERPAGKEWLKLREDLPAYGYTPEIVKKREVELKVYEQTVEEIDIKAVINSVNYGAGILNAAARIVGDAPRQVGNQPAGPV